MVGGRVMKQVSLCSPWGPSLFGVGLGLTLTSGNQSLNEVSELVHLVQTEGTTTDDSRWLL